VFRRVVVDRIVYGTITTMCVLIVYDGWTKLQLWQVVGVIVGPIVAMFLSHVFSGVIAKQVALGRSLNGAERMDAVQSEVRFLWLAVPPTVLTVVLHLAGVALTDCIQIIVWVGVASLGFWGGLAGRRAGFTGWQLVLAVLAGLVVGFLVLAIQVFLQPGEAATNGVI
jgi:hypothetical protein